MNRALVFRVTNALTFQVGWFVCVLMGNFWACLFTASAVALHLVITQHYVKDFIAMAVALTIGFLHDLSLIHFGLVQFPATSIWPPLWLNCLWILFALTLNHSLAWIYRRPLLSSLLGAIAGPLSYLAGVELSPAQWSSPVAKILLIMGTLWLLVLPLHRSACMRIEKYARRKIP